MFLNYVKKISQFFVLSLVCNLDLNAPITPVQLEEFNFSNTSKEALSYLNQKTEISGFFTADYYKAYSAFLDKKSLDEQSAFLKSGSIEADVLKSFIQEISVMKQNDETYDSLKKAGFNPESDVFKKFDPTDFGKNVANLQIVAQRGLGQIISKVAQLKTQDSDDKQFNDFADKALASYEKKTGQLNEELSFINKLIANPEQSVEVPESMKDKYNSINVANEQVKTFSYSISENQSQLRQMQKDFDSEKTTKKDSLLINKINSFDIIKTGNEALFSESIMNELLKNQRITSDVKASLEIIKAAETNEDLQKLEDAVQKVFEFKTKNQDKVAGFPEAQTLQAFKQNITNYKTLVEQLSFLDEPSSKNLSQQVADYNKKFSLEGSAQEKVTKIAEQETSLSENSAKKRFHETEVQKLIKEFDQTRAAKESEKSEIEKNVAGIESEKASIAKKQSVLLDSMDGGFKLNLSDAGTKNISNFDALNNLRKQKPVTQEEKLNLKSKIEAAEKALDKIVVENQNKILIQVAGIQKAISEQDSKLDSIFQNESSENQTKNIQAILKTKSGLMANLEIGKLELQALEFNKTIPDYSKKTLFETASAKYQTEMTEKFATTISAKYLEDATNKYFANLARTSEILKINDALAPDKLSRKGFSLKPSDRDKKSKALLEMKKNMLENIKNPEDDPNLKHLLRAETQGDFDKYNFEKDKIIFKDQIKGIEDKIKNINDKQKVLTAFLQGSISKEDFPGGDVEEFKKSLLDSEIELKRIQAGVPTFLGNLSTKAKSDLTIQNQALTILLKEKGLTLDELMKSDLTFAVAANTDAKLLLLKPVEENDVPKKTLDRKAWIQAENEIRARKLTFIELTESSKLQKNPYAGANDLEEALKLLKKTGVIEPKMLQARQELLQKNIFAGTFLTEYLMQGKDEKRSILDSSDSEKPKFSSDVPSLVQKIFSQDEIAGIKKTEVDVFSRGTVRSTVQASFGEELLRLKDTDSMNGKNGGFSQAFSRSLTGSASTSFSTIVQRFKFVFKKDPLAQELEAKTVQDNSTDQSKIPLPGVVAENKTDSRFVQPKKIVQKAITAFKSKVIGRRSNTAPNNPRVDQTSEQKPLVPVEDDKVVADGEGEAVLPKATNQLSEEMKSLQAQIKVIEGQGSGEGKIESEVARAKEDALNTMKSTLASLSESEMNPAVKIKLLELLNKPGLLDLGRNSQSQDGEGGFLSKLISFMQSIINPTEKLEAVADESKATALAELNKLTTDVDTILADAEKEKQRLADEKAAAAEKLAQEKIAADAQAEEKRVAAAETARKAAEDEIKRQQDAAIIIQMAYKQKAPAQAVIINPEALVNSLKPEKTESKEDKITRAEEKLIINYGVLYEAQQAAEKELQAAVGLNSRNTNVVSGGLSTVRKTPAEIKEIRDKAKDATKALDAHEAKIPKDAVTKARAPIAKTTEDMKRRGVTDDYAFPKSKTGRGDSSITGKAK